MAETPAIIGNWEWDLVHDQFWVCDEVCRIFCRPKESFSGGIESIYAMLDWKDAQAIREALPRVLKYQQALSGQTRILCSSGYRNIHIRSEIVIDEEGTPVRIVGVVHDVTDRLQMDRLLRDNEKMFYALLNAIADPLLILSADATVLEVNSVLSKRFGAEPQTMRGHSIWNFIPEEEALLHRNATLHVLQTRVPYRYEAQTEKTIVDLVAYPVVNSSGDVEKIAFIGRDITEKKEMEEELLSKKRIVRALLNIPTDLIVLVDRDGIICDVNATAEHYASKTKDELVGMSFWSFIPSPGFIAYRQSHFRKVLETGYYVRFNTSAPDKKAEHVYYPVLIENGRVETVSLMIRNME
jgi:PAS domain S-box-containing protein